MRFPKTLTLLLLAMGMIFALSAWAQQKPLTRNQVQGLVRSGVDDDELIAALKSAKVTKPVTVDPAAQARQAVLRHASSS